MANGFSMVAQNWYNRAAQERQASVTTAAERRRIVLAAIERKMAHEEAQAARHDQKRKQNMTLGIGAGLGAVTGGLAGPAMLGGGLGAATLGSAPFVAAGAGLGAAGGLGAAMGGGNPATAGYNMVQQMGQWRDFDELYPKSGQGGQAGDVRSMSASAAADALHGGAPMSVTQQALQQTTWPQRPIPRTIPQTIDSLPP